MCVLASSCPHLSFFPLFLPHSLLPLNPPLLPLFLSLSPEPRLRAPLTGWGMDSFHLMRLVWSRATHPEQEAPHCSHVFSYKPINTAAPAHHLPPPPPSLSLSLSLSIYLFHSLFFLLLSNRLPLSASPLPFFHPLLFFFTLYICLRLSVSFWSQGT